MSTRRLACLLLGAWIAASVFMSWVATENFLSVDRVLHDPTAAAAQPLKQLGYDGVRQLLRYQASEQNRYLFSRWEIVQLGLGLLLFGLLLFGTDVGKYTLTLPLLMLSLVGLAHWFITPQISPLGRVLDYLPPSMRIQEEVRIRAMHQAYGGIELTKLILSFLLAGFLLWRRGSRRKLREKVDAVDHAHHSHVDR